MNLRENTESYFRNLLSAELKKPVNKIHSDSPFDTLGVDSLIIMRINKSIEKEFGRIPRTLFYEYKNIRELTEYFIENHDEKLASMFTKSKASEQNKITDKITAGAPAVIPKNVAKEECPQKASFINNEVPSTKQGGYRKIGNILDAAVPAQETGCMHEKTKIARHNEDIAIIGISGRYPKADNLDEFWDILANGESCITEIPEDRWNYRDELTEYRSHWGGFLDDADKFDPLFFNISPHEAELMDPQQRLFLEECWKSLENSGYALELFLKKTNKKVGVFAGCSWTEYELLAGENSKFRPDVHPGSIATRVSYHMGLQGPSLTLDTHCSSSLMAVHLACESIRRGECRAAFAGGVNLSLHPNKYKQMNPFLSTDGKCRSFGEGGSGYVPSEGVGAVVLKPLEDAESDGDTILAVIKAEAVNHGGKTNGYSVPNPEAQCEVIKAALERAGIEPAHISYVETHGTGTELGDPIEIAGLTKAFGRVKKQFCPIGSVKSNFGHCEAAAGIEQITKVVLQMRRKMLTPSLYCEKTNPNIRFEETPFFVQRELAEWNQPHELIDGVETAIPRRAGISSFGAGGTNVHIILEEYIDKNQNYLRRTDKLCIIVLSAKTQERLLCYARKLLTWVEKHAGEENLPSVAYTLAAGRQAMKERLAVIVNDSKELAEQLDSFLNNKPSSVLRGNVERTNNLGEFIEGEEGEEFIQRLWEKRSLSKLAALWTMGVNINWDQLYGNTTKRIPLPTYPFEKLHCWLDEKEPIKTNNIQKKYLILKKDWRCSEIVKCEAGPANGDTVIFANNDTVRLAKAVGSKLSASDGRHPIVLINNFNGSRETGNGFSFESAKQGHEAAKSVTEKHTITKILDLSDLYENEPENHTACYGKIAFLQEIIKTNTNQATVILHLSNGLQTFMTQKPSVFGAEFSGIVKMLGHEYKKVLSKTVDIDMPLTEESSIISLIHNEFYMEDCEVCYRNGKRYLPYFRKIFSQDISKGNECGTDLPDIIKKDKVVVITGGTRGIGAELARHLAENGARRLVLMGREKLPPRGSWDEILASNDKQSTVYKKIAAVRKLESMGVQAEVYCGSLKDKEALSTFFENVRSRLGEICGVIHCAGILGRENLAFISKADSEMTETFEPKISGLDVLDEVLSKDNLEFFILFSSVSSVIPSLAVGGSIYAAANDYMNHFARMRFAKGQRFYKSVIWPSWKEVGMGEIKTPAFLSSGFLSQSVKDGLYLFEKALEFKDEPEILPCVADCLKLEPGNLLCKRKAEKLQEIYTIAEKNGHQSGTGTENWLLNIFSRELKIPVSQLDVNTPFGDYGVDSIIVIEIVKKIEEQLNRNIDPSAVLEYPTIQKLAGFIDDTYGECLPNNNDADRTMTLPGNGAEKIYPVNDNASNYTVVVQHENSAASPDSGKIAVIGMACNFPGSKDCENFWYNLSHGISSVKEIPSSRFNIDKYYSQEYRPGGIVSKYGGFIDGIEDFDANFFKISEEDAPYVDPLIRQFMEASVQAVRNAGYEAEELDGKKTGVFAGSRISNFSGKISTARKNTVMGVGQNFIAAHISQLFNLKGPSIVVDTACSSSIVSIHMACRSILSGESEMALAGGVDILLDERPYLLLSEAKALSPDGKCHTFDEKANGFVPGEGCGVVVLKRLEDAKRDKDRILAVIDGSAVNNDGRTMGITTPNPEAQAEVIENALKNAKVDADSIGYIEAHGTGTAIGDPIELRALTRVFSRYTDEKQFCAIGSVKTNHGHLLSAAGISSFIKVVLAINHKQIPPTLNCENPNPRFNFESSPFYPVMSLEEWKPKQGVLRAGISSFGFGGTNAHLIVCSYDYDGKTDILRKPLAPVEFKRKRFWIDNLSGGSNDDESDRYSDNYSPLLQIEFE
ncbi:MAG TPA: type I polyketide synthase [Ruminiclostridium sp.]|nr:type I polyketide synthase [Ruminiclostridium sp.]